MKGFGKEKNINRIKINKNSMIEDAINYQVAGNYSAAEKLYKILIKNGQKDSTILNNYGLICKKLSRSDESKELFEK